MPPTTFHITVSFLGKEIFFSYTEFTRRDELIKKLQDSMTTIEKYLDELKDCEKTNFLELLFSGVETNVRVALALVGVEVYSYRLFHFLDVCSQKFRNNV